MRDRKGEKREGEERRIRKRAFEREEKGKRGERQNGGEREERRGTPTGMGPRRCRSDDKKTRSEKESRSASGCHGMNV